jgi:hypothetical protein
VPRTHPVANKLRFDLHVALRTGCRNDYQPVAAIRTRIVLRIKCTSIRKTPGIGQRTLQLGSCSGAVNFFNAICRLLEYEGAFSTRLSDLTIKTDSFISAEPISAGIGLGSAFSLSIDPLQLINTVFSIITIILNSRQASFYRSENCFHKGHINVSRDVLRCLIRVTAETELSARKVIGQSGPDVSLLLGSCFSKRKPYEPCFPY